MPDTNPTTHHDAAYESEMVPERRTFSPRTRRISWIVVIVAIVLALVLIASLATGGKSGGFGGGGPGGPGGPASTVGTAQATAMDVPVSIEALGTVTPAATVTVRPQVAGAIQEILFREGQIVRKGQVLAVIDPRAYRAQLVQAQGALQRDQAQLQVARLTLRRYEVLLKQDSIARQDVDTQAAAVRELEGTVTVDRGAVQAAEVNLGFTRVISPVNGRVGLRTVDVGNYVSAGESGGIVSITTLSPIDVQFTVPQDRIPLIEKRIAQGASLSATAKDQTRTKVLGQGTFLTLNNAVSTTTGTVSAKARFANADNALYPSQFVNLTLDVDTLQGAVTVPSTATREGTSGSYVWLLKSDNSVEQRKVVTGPSYNDRVVISSGLKTGETVVTEGGDSLTVGAKVQTAATAAKTSNATKSR